MKLADRLLVKELGNALVALRKNPLLVFGASVMDLLFLFLYAFVGTFVGDQIAAHAVLIANHVSPMLAKGETGLLAKLFEGALRPLTFKLLVLMGLFFLVLFIIYVIIQGLAWWFSAKTAGTEQKFSVYLARFAKLNLVWLVFFVLIKLVDVLLGLRFQLIKKFVPGAFNLATPVMTVVFAALVLIAFLSYPRLKAKDFLHIPFLTALGLLGMCAVLFLVRWFVVENAGKVSTDLALLVSIMLLPVFVLMRVYAVRVVNHVGA